MRRPRPFSRACRKADLPPPSHSTQCGGFMGTVVARNGLLSRALGVRNEGDVHQPGVSLDVRSPALAVPPATPHPGLWPPMLLERVAGIAPSPNAGTRR